MRLKRRIALAAGLLMAGLMLLMIPLKEQETHKASTRQIQDLAGIKKPTAKNSEDPAGNIGEISADHKETDLPSPDMKALQKKNPDICGWIMVPDTVINYPVMRSPDDYYLKHTPERKEEVHGSIYVRQGPDEEPLYIFGHRMRDGSMFACLHKYSDKSYARKHSFLYLYTDTWHRYSYAGSEIVSERRDDFTGTGDLFTVTCAGRKNRLIVRWNKDN